MNILAYVDAHRRAFVSVSCLSCSFTSTAMQPSRTPVAASCSEQVPHCVQMWHAHTARAAAEDSWKATAEHKFRESDTFKVRVAKCL